MANQSPRPALPVNVPVNYPKVPTPGKIRILFDANKKDLYHKLSPYGSETFFGIKTRQPFFYTYPDEKGNTSDLFIVDLARRATQDVVRVSKWMVSKDGILFSARQFLMQTGNAFNETRIWNATSPSVAAAMPLTLWSARPTRHVDTSDLLGSFLGGIGTTIGGIFGTGNKAPKPPSGTLGDTLPSNSVIGQWGGKGLLRAGTANSALTTLNSRWPTGGGASVRGLAYIGKAIKSLFGNFLPQTQESGIKRSDQITYGLMLSSTTGENGAFSYQGVNGPIDGVQQFWFAGSLREIRKGGSGQPLNWVKIYVDQYGRPIFSKPSLVSIRGLTGFSGYEIGDTQIAVKYGDYIGTKHEDDWEGSDVLIQQSYYADDDRKYPSKLTDKTDPSVVAMNDSLNRVLTNIEKAGTYTVNKLDSNILLGNQSSKTGYDRLVATKKHGDVETQYLYSTLQEYRNARVLEANHSDQPAELSKKMASTGQFDGINTLRVLDKNKKIEGSLIANWVEWKPYRDDQIAFYFYDVVNEKYIPFRAIIRGLQETDSATWEELSFVGRADRMYNYSGFNRSLAFSFTVHINSILEMAPTWQRINYLMSLVKPSRYTIKDRNDTNLYTRFMVPPMVMVTIGDLYRNQPIVLASAGMSVPDTALWETLNADNSDEWSYLVDYIKAPRVGKLYAQLPRTVDISINAYVLEQERAIAGAAHFGKAPHSEDYQKGEYRRTLPDNAEPNEFHKSLVVYQEDKSSNYVGDANINPAVGGIA